MEAAVAGGVTSLACPPDTDPPLDEPGLVEMLKHRARSLNRAHVYPVGALTVGLKGETITEMGELAEAGCIAFSQADAPMSDTLVLWRAMQYAATFGHRVWLRPQDAHLSRGGVAHDGKVATRLGLTAVPPWAETIAIDTIVALARATGAQIHIARLSTHDGVVRVREAKRSGLAVTCDVAGRSVADFVAEARRNMPCAASSTEMSGTPSTCTAESSIRLVWGVTPRSGSRSENSTASGR